MADSHNLIVAVLVKQALRQPLSAAESRLLEEWQSRSPEHRELPGQLRDAEWREAHRKEIHETPSEAMWENISRHIRQAGESNELEQKQRAVPMAGRDRIKRIGLVAASILILVLIGGVFRQRMKQDPGIAAADKKSPELAVVARKNDSSALLLLPDGRILDLNTFHPGEPVLKENDGVLMRTDGGMAYTGGGKYAWHELSIGSKAVQPFRVDFPGGTTVWLDHASRIGYCAGLWNGPDPMVDGKAFFEIKRDSLFRPLRIRTVSGVSIDVLGTIFSVNSAGGARASEVELYDGSVRVKSHEDSVTVRPGNVAVIHEGMGPQLVRMDGVRAMPVWMRPKTTDPYFEFENTSLSAALHEVARWYLVRLANPYRVKGIPITGKLPRSQPLDNTLRALERVQSGHVFLQHRADTIYIISGDAGGP